MKDDTRPGARTSTHARYISGECMVDAHEMCPGTVNIYAPDAPPWEAPVECLHCDCTDCGHQPAAAP